MQEQERSDGASPKQAGAPEDGRLTLTVREAAKLLGISPYTAYEAAHRGELPVRFIGRRMLVPRAALLRLLDEQ
jgi:excisionase family DNA binding protein